MHAEDQTAEWLRVDAVARLLDVKPFTIVRLLNEGKLIGTYFGTREGWRVRRADLEALRGQLPTAKHDIMEQEQAGDREMTTVSTYEEPYMGMNPLPGEFAGKRFGIYPRVSTKAQSRDNKTSQDAQIEFCQEYGEGFGMDLDPVCVRKESYSSTTGDRPELNQLLRDMKARGVRNLVIDRVDRMTRADPFGAYKLLDRIVRANIWIHVASAGVCDTG